MKMRGIAHFIHSLVQRVDNGGHKGARNVANTQTDDTLVGVRLLEGSHLAGNVGKKVVALQLEKIAIYGSHLWPL